MKALYLIGCSARKLTHAAPARELYQGHLFQCARRLAERDGARWFVLSARHGLVAPHTIIAPYERRLSDMRPALRGEWREMVAAQLEALASPLAGRRVVFFAGAHYRVGLSSWLRSIGALVETPLAHLGIGQQKRWLLDALAERGAA